MKDELLKLCYQKENEYKADMYLCGENSERAFDCLIAIVEDGTISTFDELSSYGIDKDD